MLEAPFFEEDLGYVHIISISAEMVPSEIVTNMQKKHDLIQRGRDKKYSVPGYYAVVGVRDDDIDAFNKRADIKVMQRFRSNTIAKDINDIYIVFSEFPSSKILINKVEVAVWFCPFELLVDRINIVLTYNDHMFVGFSILDTIIDTVEKFEKATESKIKISFPKCFGGNIELGTDKQYFCGISQFEKLVKKIASQQNLEINLSKIMKDKQLGLSVS